MLPRQHRHQHNTPRRNNHALSHDGRTKLEVASQQGNDHSWVATSDVSYNYTLLKRNITFTPSWTFSFYHRHLLSGEGGIAGALAWPTSRFKLIEFQIMSFRYPGLVAWTFGRSTETLTFKCQLHQVGFGDRTRNSVSDPNE